MDNNNFEFIIIGAGMAGLTAARGLLEAGKKVAVIEGRARIGGRIKTLEYQFSQPVDAGAEFVHGSLPFTKKLAKKAGVSMHTKKGKLYKYENGAFTPVKNMIDDYKKVMSRLKDLKTDMPLSQFIKTSLADTEDTKARKSVMQTAQGFDVAETEKLSSFSVRDEWKDADSMTEPDLIKNGYGTLVNFLYQQCIDLGCKIYLSSPVTGITWKKDIVKIRCGEQMYIEGAKVIITVPLGILTASESEANYIRFIPPVNDKINAAKKIGFGPVVKGIFQFKTTFWDSAEFKTIATQLPELGFFVAEGVLPTWWTQAPTIPILTGWAGGPDAAHLKNTTNEEIFEQAVASLALLFACPVDFIKQQLITYKITNWGNDLFTKGGYSYTTLETAEAQKVLLEPVENTLFFCGEGLDEENSGTVEAAISSATQLLKKLL